MSSNPMIAQGTLNRLRGSVIVNGSPELNVTASYVGKGGIGLALEGEVVTFLDTLTGGVQSPAPYMRARVTVNLIKSQGLAAIYKTRMETLATVGDITIKSDASTLPDYTITNCAIESVREMVMNGEDAGFVVMMSGYYLINNQLWSLV